MTVEPPLEGGSLQVRVTLVLSVFASSRSNEVGASGTLAAITERAVDRVPSPMAFLARTLN